nr:MAG TPA: hypothetical protein [Bacteriophage sp.]
MIDFISFGSPSTSLIILNKSFSVSFPFVSSLSSSLEELFIERDSLSEFDNLTLYGA